MKFALTVIISTIAAQIIHMIGAGFGMGYYTDPNYFPVWSNIMMPSSGPPPASFLYWSLAIGIVTWAFFTWGYTILKNSVPGSGYLQKGMMYGILVFLVSGFSGSLALFLLINLPKGLIVLWGIEGLIILGINGIITAKLN